ncbi:MAG: glycosyltransferase family 4 protein [Methylocapsa sp.]|nr:glycosyltransferase family 4 protein [Methylocapsa sp.]
MQPCLTINGGFLSQKITGVQRYGREIVVALDRLLQDLPLRSILPARIVAPAGAEPRFPLSAISLELTAAKGGPFLPLWYQLILPFAVRGVLLSLCNMGPLLARTHILCIHDLNVILARESYSRAFRIYYRTIQPLLAKRAARVVTVSQFSAQMLAAKGICPAQKISVIPNGHEHVARWRPNASPFAAEGAHRRPFIFVLGSRARHKNIAILFAIAREIEALGLDIVVAGSSATHFSDPGPGSVPPNVRMAGYVTDDDLAALFQRALCFAFPSLAEGFGLPALEAMALGCPVIASRAASLPEVCADAALYADPRTPEDWLGQIKRLQSDPALAPAMRAKGLHQAKRFSWAKSAELYLDLAVSLSGMPIAGSRRAAFPMQDGRNG